MVAATLSNKQVIYPV